MTPDQAGNLIGAVIALISAITLLITTYNKIKLDQLHEKVQEVKDTVQTDK